MHASLTVASKKKLRHRVRSKCTLTISPSCDLFLQILATCGPPPLQSSLVLHSRSEASDGRLVEGEYRTLLPDGRTQIVRYRSAPDTGFVAEVEYLGEAKPVPAVVKRHPRPPRRIRKTLLNAIRWGRFDRNGYFF